MMRQAICAHCDNTATRVRTNRAGRYIPLCLAQACLSAEWDRDAAPQVWDERDAKLLAKRPICD